MLRNLWFKKRYIIRNPTSTVDESENAVRSLSSKISGIRVVIV